MSVTTKTQAIDHYLQLDILQKLVNSEDVRTFSELKENGIDNSLFSYHMNKMLAKGLVAKQEGGYKLTKNGARLLLWTRENMFIEPEPRSLINFIVRKNGKVLLAKRKGANKDLLNTFLLPGGMTKYGEPQSKNIDDLCKKRFGQIAKYVFIANYEYILTSADGYTSHRILFLYEITSDVQETNLDERYEQIWIDEAKLQDMLLFKSSLFIPDVFALLDKKIIQPFNSATFAV